MILKNQLIQRYNLNPLILCQIMNIELPNYINDNDKLGRAIFSRGQAQRAILENTDHKIFLVQKGEQFISIDRFFSSYLEKLTEIQDKNAQKRSEIETQKWHKGELKQENQPKRRSFYGWASLAALDARQDNRQVQPDPIRENPYHANIILPEDTHDEYILHAKALAAKSEWVERYK